MSNIKKTGEKKQIQDKNTPKLFGNLRAQDLFKNLREQAEAKIAKNLKNSSRSNSLDVDKLLQELNVHQIELEMQNEKLYESQLELQDVSQKYFHLYSNSPVSYLSLDQHRMIIETNQAATILLGLPKAKLFKYGISRFIKKEYQPLFNTYYSQILKSPAVQKCELQLINANNEVIYVRLEGIRDSNSKNNPIVNLTLLDITERKKTEIALIKNNKDLNLANFLLQSAKDIILALDMDSNIISYNKSCEVEFLKLFGRKLEFNANFLSFLSDFPIVQDTFYGIIYKALDSNEFVVNKCLNIKGISPTWYEISYNSITDNNNNRIGLCFIIRNITAGVEAEEKLRSHQKEHADATRSNLINSLTTALAHEISQPLSCISTYAESFKLSLIENMNQLGRLQENINQVITQTGYATNVVERMTSFFNKSELKFESISIEKLVQQTIDLTKVEINNNIIQLEIGGDLPSLHVDKIQIQQVLINLLRNAYEAMSLARIENPKIILRVSRLDNEAIIFEIIDNGPGVPLTIVNKLLISSVTTKAGGMGLGLLICRTIIEAHGGHLEVKSPTLQGCWIRFTLPL